MILKLFLHYLRSSWSVSFPVNTHGGDEDEEELTLTMSTRGCSNTTVNTHRRRTKHAIGRSRRRPAKVTKKTQKKLFREEEEGFEEGCEGHQWRSRRSSNGEEEEEWQGRGRSNINGEEEEMAEMNRFF